ncbi:MAG: T9SS type A sorting domain-containing protein [Bacteroidota bacterium]
MKLIFLSIFYLLLNLTNAQLVVVGLQENSSIRKHLLLHPESLLKSRNSDTLDLPFFDDFTNGGVFPDSMKWIDKDAFINNTYPDLPPNFNVATLDVIGFDGLLYQNASTSTFNADYLTSKPIDLSGVTVGDSLYLSFYYQPGGLAGDYPDIKDSLVLEFTVPDTSWFYVWSMTGSSTHDFKQIMIPLTNPLFFKKGFQFRFYNYATLGDPLKPSWQSNCDYWHLDFIYLDTARTKNDTIIDDVGMIFINSGKSSFLSGYESVPWKHFTANSIPFINSIYATSRNLFSSTRLIDINYYLIDVYNNVTLIDESIGSENNEPLDTLLLFKSFPVSPFPSNTADSALFEIKTYINNSNNISPIFYPNDTMSYFQKFYNYYAYDDGTPEAGIGVYGNNTNNGRFCVRYKTYQPDTLVALQIFFNNTNESYQKYFHLTVWDNDNGKPGDTIYQKIGEIAQYGWLNQFNNYTIDRQIIVTDTFYIGWQKVNTIELMNVGFDLNRNAQENVFYSLTDDGAWNSSTHPGAPMIRPVFRKNYLIGKPDINIKDVAIDIYPNPAKEFLSINTDIENKEKAEIYFYDCSGKLIYKEKYKEMIDISSIEPGIYFLRISDENSVSCTRKVVIIP